MEKGRVGVGAVSAVPATLYKFCIILAMNSSFCSKADRSKGGEGPGESWGRVKMHTESFKVLDRAREGGVARWCWRRGRYPSPPHKVCIPKANR